MAAAALSINNPSGNTLYDDVVRSGCSVEPLQPDQSNSLSIDRNSITIKAAPPMRI
jgi:hypothetical protein